MFKIEDDNRVTLTRGDSCAFDVEIKNDQGEIYTPTDSDVITLTLKKDAKTAEVLIKKFGPTIVFNPDDTNKFRYGNYLYDVTLTTAGGAVYTIIPPTEFVISDEIHWERGN